MHARLSGFWHLGYSNPELYDYVVFMQIFSVLCANQS